MRIRSRREWGARTPRAMTDQGPPTKAFVHYSMGQGRSIQNLRQQIACLKSIQNYHMDTQGWSDIGYAYIVFQPYGKLRRARVFAGRPTSKVPAAQAGANTGSLPICVVAAPGEPLKRNTRYVIEQLIKKHRSVNVVGGHRDVVATSCPGDLIYAALPQIAKAAGVRLHG